MTHLDEGTIHAWLDGALDATRASEVDAHVAQCAQCASAVAEARGFIAGASRIMAALDDVPGSVIPGKAPAPAVAPRARRMWRASPWVTGIAALFIGAVVLSTATVRKALDSSAPMVELAQDTQVPLSMGQAPPPSAASLQERLGPTAANTPSVAPAEGRLQQRQLAKVEADMDLRSASRARSAADAGGAGAAAPGAAAPGAAAPAVAEQSTRVEPKMGAVGGVAGAALLSAVVDTLTVTGRYAGCYRLEPVTDETRVSSAVAEAMSGAGRRAAAAPSAPAPAAARERRDYAALRAPAIVRLDTASLDTARAALGLVVKAVGSDSTIGSWRVVRDSARVELRTGGSITLGRAQRIPCPQP